MAGVAAEILKANRARNCHLFPCHSTEMDDPPRVDVVVSETLGNYAFEEHIAETLNDARRRFLKPGGVIIPARLEQVVAPVVAQDPRRALRLGRGRLRSRPVGRAHDEPQQRLRAHARARSCSTAAEARRSGTARTSRVPFAPTVAGRPAGGSRLRRRSMASRRGGRPSSSPASPYRRVPRRRARIGSSSTSRCCAPWRRTLARRSACPCARAPREKGAPSPGRRHGSTARDAPRTPGARPRQGLPALSEAC